MQLTDQKGSIKPTSIAQAKTKSPTASSTTTTIGAPTAARTTVNINVGNTTEAANADETANNASTVNTVDNASTTSATPAIDESVTTQPNTNMAGFEPQTNILIHMVGSGLHQEPDVAYAGLGPGADTIPRLESAEPSDVLSDITPTVGYGWHPIVRNRTLRGSQISDLPREKARDW